VDWLIEANVLEKCAVSIFRTEVMIRDLEGLCKVAGEVWKEPMPASGFLIGLALSLPYSILIGSFLQTSSPATI
jgi:hypothetical protein